MHGLLDFRTGEISKQLELNLNDVKSSEQINFDVILQQPTASGKLGAKSRANVTVFAEEGRGFYVNNYLIYKHSMVWFL